MQCPRCQEDNPTGVRFCGGCGARLESSCPTCQAANPPTNKFCYQCGAALRAATSPPVPSPQSYTPKHLAEKILTSRAALEGERKQVTVLFADLKGSLELLADRDPEEARKLLDPVLERMMEAVHRYEGTVNQVMGDGVMALFGAPVAHEDHAVRACYAALDMQAAIRRYTEEVRRSHGLAGVQIRVGLNSGEVVVRAIGSDLHMDYTAVGQITHLAARMEQLAPAGGTLLTADTLRLAEGYIDVKALGPVPVRGLEGAIEVYEMIGAGPRHSRFHSAAGRGLTRFVGRESELEHLRQILGRAAAGHGQVVALVGEPGVGKSRHVWEAIHSHRTHGWLVLQAGSVSYRKATPYLPVIDLLTSYFQIGDRDDHRTIRDKLTGKLLALDRALEPGLPALLALLGVPMDDPHWQALDPPQRRQRTLDAVKRLLLEEGQLQPLLVVFEDLQWIDTETQALLDSLVESLPAARMVLLVNYRPEYQHSWGSKSYYVQLRLDPLPPESAQELLQALVGEDRTLQPIEQLLIDRAEGNPFFLEESVRTLAETHVIVGERGAYRLVKALSSIQVPATVQAVLAARIDRLLPEDKALLQTAAVIGKDVPFRLLQAIADQPDDDLRRSLARLQSAEFLYETSPWPEGEYTFKHALTHEVAYGSLLQERRRTLHTKIVGAIERLYADRLADFADRLAQHARRAQLSDAAIRYFRMAGHRALAQSANARAASQFQEALGLLARMPESEDRLRLDIDLRCDLRNSLELVEPEKLIGSLVEAEAMAKRIGDRRRLGAVASYMTHACWVAGKLQEASTYGAQGVALGSELGEAAIEIPSAYHLGLVYLSLGRHLEANRLLDGVVERASGDLLYERLGLNIPPSILARSYLARSLAEVGEFAISERRAKECVAQAEELGSPYACGFAYLALGHLALIRGDDGDAIELLERSRASFQDSKTSVMAPVVAAFLGRAYNNAGHTATALALLEVAIRITESMRVMDEQPLRMLFLAEAYQRAGRLTEASDVTRRALALAVAQAEESSRAYALRQTGLLLLDRFEPEDGPCALQYLSEAIALARELDMRPLVARCRHDVAGAHERLGDFSEARAERNLANAEFSALGLHRW